MVEFGERLKWAMQHRPGGEWTVRQLSSAMGLSYQAVRKVLIGESRAFTAENNDKAASLLGVHSRWLATGKGPAHTGAPPDPPASPYHLSEHTARPYRATPAAHPDVWINEAIRTLEALNPEDRRAAVINLRVFRSQLSTPEDGQALPVAA